MTNPIQRYLVAKKMDQAVLAARVGVNRSTVSRWAKGTVAISRDKIDAVHKATGISKVRLQTEVFSPNSLSGSAA